MHHRVLYLVNLLKWSTSAVFGKFMYPRFEYTSRLLKEGPGNISAVRPDSGRPLVILDCFAGLVSLYVCVCRLSSTTGNCVHWCWLTSCSAPYRSFVLRPDSLRLSMAILRSKLPFRDRLCIHNRKRRFVLL